MNVSARPSEKSVPRLPLARLGGKAANLIHLQSAGFNVPEFVVSPEKIQAEIQKLGFPLVVRSSACGEDGTDVSFAGQFRSFLNLKTIEQVQESVELCRASVKSQSVQEYCHRQCFDHSSLRMEVIIQRMIQPELSGVVFTVNPVTGAEEVVIEACKGLSDELLAGRKKPLPPDHSLMQTYSKAIRSVALRIQQHFGLPQDIEFAIESGTIYILQSRPITRIGFDPSIGQWTNADFRDGGVSSTVCSPLMNSLYQLIWDGSLKGTLRELKLLKSDFVASHVFFGRLYWNLGAVKQCVSALPGFNEREFDRDLSVQIGYQGDGRVTPMTPLGIIRAIPTVIAVKRFFRTQQDAAEQLLSNPIQTRLQHDDPDGNEIESDFRRLIETEYVPIESTYFRTIFAASLAKMDFMTAFPKADYVSLVSALPPLCHVEPVRAVQSMPERTPDELERVIDRYRYHYRMGLDLIHPRWDDDRPFVRRMLAELPESAGANPNTIYQSAREAFLRQLPRRKHATFFRKLYRLRHFLWLREQLRDVSSYVYFVIRRYVVELAKRRGIEEAIFFQTYQEIFSDDRSNIGERRKIYQSYRHFRAPGEIGSGYHFQPRQHGSEIRGIAASPGRTSGTSFVARDVGQASGMSRGQILICPYTDPGWTAVLDRAGGVVAETGGLLSHAAIICREYGIPAVLGVEEATDRIADGTSLMIDGSEGRVSLNPESSE